MTSLFRTPSSTPRISGPVELIQAVPYLLGFHPQDSLVIIGLKDGYLEVTARMDVADLEEPRLLGETIASLRRGGVTTFVGLVYLEAGTPADPPADAVLAADRLSEAVAAVEGRLAEVLVVTGSGWWSARCEHTGCASVHGGPLPTGTSDYALAATVAGVAPLSDRVGLEAVLAPLPAAERVPAAVIRRAEHDGVLAVLESDERQYRLGQLAALTGAARASGSAQWSPPGDAECARLAVALTWIRTRDEVWMRVDEGRLDGRELWRELARRLPDAYRPAALLLYGWAMWRHGNGALARVAAEQAVTIDPEYTAADLLLGVLTNAMNPRTTPRLRTRSRAGGRNARGGGGARRGGNGRGGGNGGRW